MIIEGPFINDVLRVRHPELHARIGIRTAAGWALWPSLPVFAALNGRTGDAALEVMKISVRVGWAYPLVLLIASIAIRALAE